MADSTDNDIAISVRDIHKEFILPQSKNSSFKQTFVNIVKKNNKVTQKVLDGISFDVKKGDFFGIVGRNGSGKSTLLKMLAGVYTPTAGEIQVNGGLTPFIELGVGFNPELSGRDNVYLNGALLGFDRSQMDEMYDEIVAFAELEPFMDQKLKNYSSGMQVRLAFSIAIKAKNEVLIFDEVLAVGDEAFQRKCLDVFERYKAEGQTVILVTHEMATVKKYCNRAILIHDGKIIEEGNPQIVADTYSKKNQQSIDNAVDEPVQDDKSVDVELSSGNKRVKSLKTGDFIDMTIRWQDAGITSVMIDLFKLSGEHVSGFKSSTEGYLISNKQASVQIKADLSPGKYFFKISLRNDKDEDVRVLYHSAEFTITQVWTPGKEGWAGLVPIDHKWI